jgi:hypothetical protein
LRLIAMGALTLYVSFFLLLGHAGPREAPLLVVLAATVLAFLLLTAWGGRSPEQEWAPQLRSARERRGF